MTETPSFLKSIIDILEDMKANDITAINVKEQTSITDYMIICSARSSRQVKAIANEIIVQMKTKGLHNLSAHGLESGEWALIDLGDFVIHVMQPEIRAFYNIEALWQDESHHQS
jgi:ribosome-associated protein